MNLYIWYGNINNERYSVYSLAPSIAAAKEKALDSAPLIAKEEVRVILNSSSPQIFDDPSSFIIRSSSQLV
jgi:hypothetical protein